MDKYLIAVDMDGTLLNSKNQISEYTARTLQKALDMGHLIVPASGRALGLLPEELHYFKSISYAVAENGAFVWDYAEKKALLREILPEESLRDILIDCKRVPCFAEVFADGEAYAELSSLLNLDHTVQSENFIRYYQKNHHFVKSLEEEPGLLSSAEKINLYFEDAEDAERFRKTWKRREGLLVTTSVGDNVEITRTGVSKGAGLRFLRETLKFPKERVIAFGDNDNDLEMFEEAGLSVAMGNAKEAIRQKADHVTETCDADGVAVFLETYLKEKRG